MAIVEFTPTIARVSGRSGNFVYRRTLGTTVLACRPTLPAGREATTAQQAQRDRFAAARHYAQQVLADPWQRRIYETLGRAQNRRADRVAMSDFLTPPQIEEIDASPYARGPGDLIRIMATDDIEVVSVEVAIRTAAGERIESGPATCDHGVWRYKTTATAPTGTPLIIAATAKDRPGNVATAELVCP